MKNPRHFALAAALLSTAGVAISAFLGARSFIADSRVVDDPGVPPWEALVALASFALFAALLAIATLTWRGAIRVGAGMVACAGVASTGVLLTCFVAYFEVLVWWVTGHGSRLGMPTSAYGGLLYVCILIVSLSARMKRWTRIRAALSMDGQ